MAVFYGFDDNNMAMMAPTVKSQFDPSAIPESNRTAGQELAGFGQGVAAGWNDTAPGEYPNALRALGTGVLGAQMGGEGRSLDEARDPGANLEWSGSEGYPVFGKNTQSPYALEAPAATVEQIQQGDIQVAPDSMQDPAGAIKAMNFNRSHGVGNVTGTAKPPVMPTMKQQSERIQQEESKQILFDQSKVPNWYESNSFYNGLLTMGLNLLAGNDIATAFNQAGKVFDQNFGIEKRQAWADELRAYGYDDTEIAKYIETGDNKVLTDPMERQRQARRDALAEAQLRQAEYTSSPEYQEYLRGKEAYGMELQAKTDARADQQLALQQAQFAESQRQNDILNQMRIAEHNKKMQGEGTGRYNETFEKAQNQYIRGRQGLKNYQDTETRLAPKYDEQGMGRKLLNSKIIDMVFDGKEISTQMARMMDNDATELITAEREFLAPLLRKDSGAAISAGEWRTTGEVYFPRPGDSPERRQQKQQAREVAVLAMNPQASPQLKQALNMYTTGNLPGLRVMGHKVYANDGKGWFEIPQ